MSELLKRIESRLNSLITNLLWAYHHQKAMRTTTPEEAEENRQKLIEIWNSEPDLSKVRNPIEDSSMKTGKGGRTD